MRFPGDSNGKGSACNARNLGLIPGSGRSPGEGNGSPLQYSCLENPMDRGAWQAAVHGVSKSLTQLNQLSTHAYMWRVGCRTRLETRILVRGRWFQSQGERWGICIRMEEVGWREVMESGSVLEFSRLSDVWEKVREDSRFFICVPIIWREDDHPLLRWKRSRVGG